VAKLTPAQAAEVAKTGSLDDLTEQERPELDRLEAELWEHAFYERLAQTTAAPPPKPRRSPAATRSRQARSRRRPRRDAGTANSDDDGADPEAAAPLGVWTLDGAVADGQLRISVQDVKVCAPECAAEREVSPS
jgi:hypothetical protein